MKKQAIQAMSDPDNNEPKETREQIGTRLALKRMPQLKKRLQTIGKLGAYPLGERRVELMCDTIDQWANAAKVLLRNHNSDTDQFHF